MKTKLTVLSILAAAGLASAQQARIVGGGATTTGAYPFMTALIEKGATPANGQFCGAALVAPQWVLTAGHCLEGTPATSLEVWIGGRNLNNAAEGIRVGVTQVISHPNFGENAQGALVYDFCLLKLSRAVTEIAPLPLIEAAAQVAPGITARAIGWGATSEGGSGSTSLLQVDLPIVSLTIAGQSVSGLGATHIAAGRASGGIDTCQGDSGGPLLVRNASGAWLHSGTVSFGNGCARPGEYGIYGNTIALKPWILSYIGGAVTPTDDHSNTTVNASALSLGGNAIGNLEVGNDMDVFKVMLTAAGTVTINSTGSTDVVGTLLSSTGATLATDDSGNGAPNFRLTHTATAATTLFVRVSGKTAATTGGYGLNATFTSTTPNVGDIDVRNGSIVIPMNGSVDYGTRPVNGTALSRTITLANTGKAALAINSVSVTGSDFRISTQPAKSIAAGKTTGFSVSFKPTSAGAKQATLTITSNDPDENPFTVILTGIGQGAGDDHGNSIATATTVAFPSTTAGVINSGTDLDFFKITLSSARSVTLKSTGSVDTYATLYDASGNILTEADDDIDTNFLINETLPAGIYYLSVEGYSSTDLGAYSLSVR
jgi:secreted trypsin-like serine protease